MYVQSSLQHQAWGGLLITFNRSCVWQPERPDLLERQGQFYMSPLVDMASAAWESCCFIWALREQQGERARCISALLLASVQWGAAMHAEMGSIELTQDIISCQRFVASLLLFFRYSPKWTWLIVVADVQNCVLVWIDLNIKKYTQKKKLYLIYTWQQAAPIHNYI